MNKFRRVYGRMYKFVVTNSICQTRDIKEAKRKNKTGLILLLPFIRQSIHIITCFYLFGCVYTHKHIYIFTYLMNRALI